jgi:hypothetical protein
MIMHSIHRRFLTLALVAGVGLSLACRTEAQTEARLHQEVDRLEALLKKVEPMASKGSPALAAVRSSLAQVRKETSPPVFIYQLHEPFVEAEKLAFFVESGATVKDLPHLESLWAERKQRFAPQARPLPEAPLLAGLAQASENRAEKLYRAALPYGKATGQAQSGLYYLGEAEGEMRFHDFVVTLSLPPGKDRTPDAAAMRTALESMEAEMEKGFATDAGSPTMIQPSALLKEARELLERGSGQGAALLLLQSRLELSRRLGTHAKAPARPEPPAPKPALTEGSLIAPFLALAAGDQDETARIVRADVVPLYRSFFRKSS